MLFARLCPVTAVLVFANRVTAHGQVTGIVAGGKYYQGYVPSNEAGRPAPKLAGWSIPEDSTNGPVYPDGYSTQDIVCHVGATAGAIAVQVEAGSTVELEWTPWPVTHHGPVIDYIANCNGPCETADKPSLKFNKIDAVGLLGESTGPGAAGFWGADKLRTNNNTWSVTIPSSIAKGNYVLRHEIIALHDARTINGAQNYPHCINLQVTGTGTDDLATGTLGTALYKPGEPGIQIDIYKPLQYQMPGPPLYQAGSTASTAGTANPGLGGGLDNMGNMAAGGSASVAVASQAMSTIASGTATNVVSATSSVYARSTSLVAVVTPTPLASAPYTNSTKTNMTVATSYPAITSQISVQGASPSTSPGADTIQTAASLVDNVSNTPGSVQVNGPSSIMPSYPSSVAQVSVATTPAAINKPIPTAAAATKSTPATYASLPLNPNPSLFAGMSTSELMLYLKAIVAALGEKIDVSQSKRRRHARDVRSS